MSKFLDSVGIGISIIGYIIFCYRKVRELMLFLVFHDLLLSFLVKLMVNL